MEKKRNRLIIIWSVAAVFVAGFIFGLIKLLETDERPALVLATDSWATVAQVSQSGAASRYYSVGDEKVVTLSISEGVTEDVVFVILGFNHDDIMNGRKAGITLGMKNLLQTNYKMNETATNIGGWKECDFRNNTVPLLLSQMPAYLVPLIKTVNKKSTAGGASTNVQTTADKLFLFSQVETDGTTNAGYKDEGQQYEYWKIIKDGSVQANRIKTRLGTNQGHFLRSASTEYSNIFNLWANNGALDFKNTGAAAARGICFGFCI